MACNPSPCWKLQKHVSGSRTRTRNHTRNRAIVRRRADVHMLRRLKIQGHLPKLHQTAGQSQGHCFTHDGLQQICTGAGYKEMPALQTKWMHSPANQLKAGSCPATGFAAHERVTLSCKDPTHARSIIRSIEWPAGIQRPYHFEVQISTDKVFWNKPRASRLRLQMKLCRVCKLKNAKPKVATAKTPSTLFCKDFLAQTFRIKKARRFI